MLLNLLRRTGIDKSVLFTILGRLLQAVCSFGGIILISKFLSKAEQGYYYTFTSIAALQIFFELGLSTVISQVVAHEFAHLSYDESNYSFCGQRKHIERLSSFLRFIFNWYKYASVVLFLFVAPVGYLFFFKFSKLQININWQLPWFILIFSTAAYLFITPYLSFIEAIGKIKEVAKFRFLQVFISNTILFICLISGHGLYGIGLFTLSNFLCSLFGFLLPKYKYFFNRLWKEYSDKEIISWKIEIMPFQWRIALSWLSGYFIFQLFNPLLFAFQGPVVAGQMGISMAAFSGINGIAMAWMTTKIPLFSGFIAKKDFVSLDLNFFRALWQSLVVIIILCISFVGLILFMQHNENLSKIGLRFLTVPSLLYLAIVAIVNQIIFAFAIYLRSHKQEPLLINSVVGGILTTIVSYLAARYYGITALTLSNMLLTCIIGLPWVLIIFKKKRLAWH